MSSTFCGRTVYLICNSGVDVVVRVRSSDGSVMWCRDFPSKWLQSDKYSRRMLLEIGLMITQSESRGN